LPANGEAGTAARDVLEKAKTAKKVALPHPTGPGPAKEMVTDREVEKMAKVAGSRAAVRPEKAKATETAHKAVVSAAEAVV
jgi:hypothetical protein